MRVVQMVVEEEEGIWLWMLQQILAGGWGFNPGAGVMNEGTALGP